MPANTPNLTNISSDGMPQIICLINCNGQDIFTGAQIININTYSGDIISQCSLDAIVDNLGNIFK